jgi:hypothetical protein
VSENPFKDDRVEKILEIAGIQARDYQWLFDLPDRKNQGRVDVYSEDQSSQQMTDLLAKVNRGFPIHATPNKVDWNKGEFIQFYVIFNDKGEWFIK